MMIVKKDFEHELSETEKERFAVVKDFVKGKGISVLASKEVVGKGQLGVEMSAWVLIMVKDGMIIKKDIQDKPVQLLEAMEKMATDYNYYY